MLYVIDGMNRERLFSHRNSKIEVLARGRVAAIKKLASILNNSIVGNLYDATEGIEFKDKALSRLKRKLDKLHVRRDKHANSNWLVRCIFRPSLDDMRELYALFSKALRETRTKNRR